MKNVLMLGLLFGLFMITTSETCEDCDQVVLEELESCALEVESLEFQTASLNTTLDQTLLETYSLQAGRICPPPCRTPNPCDICTGCNVASCLLYFNLDATQFATVTIRDANQSIVGQSEGTIAEINENFGKLSVDLSQIPQQGIGTLEITTIDANQGQETIAIPFDFQTEF